MEDMRTPERKISISPESVQSAMIFSDLTGQAGDAARGGFPVPLPSQEKIPRDLKTYVMMCREYTGLQELLPIGILRQTVTEILRDSRLKEHFPEGRKCIVAVMPFSERGYQMEEDEINEGFYVKRLMTYPSGDNPNVRMTESGFGFYPSYVNMGLPDEVQECGYEIVKYPDNKLSATDDDRKRIALSYMESYRKLKESMEGVSDVFQKEFEELRSSIL